VTCREVRTIETCDRCGFQNHVVVCYSAQQDLNKHEADFCLGCGDTIKSKTCLAIFVAECPTSLIATLGAFKSGRLCASLEPPEGIF
jgi:tRNA A37 threonylcarbamoyladenosine dehydratase